MSRTDRPLRVLLADDHAMVRQSLVKLLEQQGSIEVIGEAEDGITAVVLALRMRPEVVIMDVQMPAMNGIAATRALTAQLPGVRVIGLSAHKDPETARAMQEAGASAHIGKGEPWQCLLTAIWAEATRIPALEEVNSIDPS